MGCDKNSGIRDSGAHTSAECKGVEHPRHWVDGDLEQWWARLLWNQYTSIYTLPWPMRTFDASVDVSDVSQRWPHRWEMNEFAGAYPGLAPYYPVPNAGYDWLDAWTAQSYYSVWW